MRFSDIRPGIEIISSMGGTWKVLRKFTSDSYLIKRKRVVCVLSKGQARFFRQRIYIKRVILSYTCQRKRKEKELIISNLSLPPFRRGRAKKQ